MSDEKNYLGLDWGTTNVGVALAHAETRVALPYTVLPNDALLFDELGKIMTAENIGTVVIGVPSYVHQDSAEHPSITFGKNISQQFHVNVEFQNEMFTTKMAQENLKERREKGISKHDDEESARIILESWLSSLK